MGGNNGVEKLLTVVRWSRPHRKGNYQFYCKCNIILHSKHFRNVFKNIT